LNQAVRPAAGESDDDSDDDEASGPLPPPAYQPELEYDPAAFGVVSTADGDDADDDVGADGGEAPLFPTTHELALKDHTKVVSALALDPSGARVLSGSHDYDCKLWDFGGMDWRCKPFKSWEPAGMYYVRRLPVSMYAVLMLAPDQ
jgi:hypothetical protein